MIRNTVVNTLTYFYPLGNTPAVSLTQDLPHEFDADILLLGCGDARNILFTCYADPNRRFDITCCDIETAVIARNVILYTLLIDDTRGVNQNEIWEIYYHWRISNKAEALLSTQAGKLLSLSTSPAEWRLSAYGETVRFCNERTINKIRSLWQAYTSQELSSIEQSVRKAHFQDNIERARQIRNDIVGQGILLGCVRSASPVGIYSVADFSKVAKRWWSEGTTSAEIAGQTTTQLNPLFVASPEARLTLHYGTDPLVGFPLAPAYVPILEDNPSGLKSEEYLVKCAQSQFRKWTDAFRNSITQRSVLRFCIADALALALTIRNSGLDDQVTTSNLRCDNWSSDPLILDDKEYAGATTGPTRFDIVDTSNLIDHLGPLNLLPICATLLKSELSSTIYSESLVQHETSEKDRVGILLGGEIRTVALLIGLSPCEIWTNATNTAEDESVLDMVTNTFKQSQIHDVRQLRTRLRWKLLRPQDRENAQSMLRLGPSEVAKILINLYDHMFEHEDVSTLFRNFKLSNLSKRELPLYNRVSFGYLVKHMQWIIVTDWDKVFAHLVSNVSLSISRSPISANCFQEFLLYMHMLDINTKQFPQVDLATAKGAKLFPLFRTWANLPPQMCLTLRVPRKTLAVITSHPATKIGTPTLKCEIEDREATPRPWSNMFAAVQTAFGSASLSQRGGETILQIVEDPLTWWGKSDMFISMFVPTWMMLQSKTTMPVVKCGFIPTLQVSKIFAQKLGLELKLFEANVISDNVTISRCMPSMSGLPVLFANKPVTQSKSNCSINAIFSPDGLTIVSLVGRAEYRTEAEQNLLSDRSQPVHVNFQDIQRASIHVANKICTYVTFPVPIDQSKHKVRIARKSSYVELEAPLWHPLNEKSASHIFPVLLLPCSDKSPYLPVAWTATRLNLDVLPAINLSVKSKLSWLTTHTSMMFSTRERQIRQAGIDGRLPIGQKPSNRVEIKEGIFSIIMSYTGLQGPSAKIFGLTRAGTGGINILFIPSCIKLDLVNRTIVLDAAAIPLKTGMQSNRKVENFYQSLSSQQILQVKVSDTELSDWKSMLPALSERCRTWQHKSTCEYAAKEQVPIAKGLEEGFTPLCSCGIGKFPANYLADTKINNLDYVLRHYATRIALSPIFAVPHVEDCFPTRMAMAGSTNSCAGCGNKKRKGPDAQNSPLLVCGRCKKVKYCSSDCQKAHWKTHKQQCSVKGA